MSVSGEKDPIECRLRIDGTEVLFSSSDSSVINILKIPRETFPLIAATLARDVSSFSDILESQPLSLVDSLKGMSLDVSSDSVEITFRESGGLLGLKEHGVSSPGLYLLQHQIGSASSTLHLDRPLQDDDIALATTKIDFENFTDSKVPLPSGVLTSGVCVDDHVLPFVDLQFISDKKITHMLVVSKALGEHVLCSSERRNFESKDLSFIGCFAFMDLLLVTCGDVDRAKMVLDVAAEAAVLVRDYVDLAWAADQLDCAPIIIEALARRALLALQDDYRNRRLNAQFIPQLAELCLLKVEDGKHHAESLLRQLLEDRPDTRTLREGADLALQLVNPDLNRELRNCAIDLASDFLETESPPEIHGN